jgi:hypothetical protein
MGRQFIHSGQAVYALRVAERQAVYGALSDIDVWASPEEPGEEIPHPECADLLEQLAARIDLLDTTAYLLEQGDMGGVTNYNPLALPCEIPVDDPEWAANPELNVILDYAPGGLLVPPEDVAALDEAISGVVSIAQGRCAIRTRWGLIGAVAVLGALVVGGGALIYANRKRR